MNIALPLLNGDNLITHSRSSSFRMCPRRHHYEYNLGIRTSGQANYYRIGHAIHAGLDARARGSSTEDSLVIALSSYDVSSDEIEYEKTTVVQLLCGYWWKWEQADVPNDIRVKEYHATEHAFEIPIRHPITGRPTAQFMAAGKIDKIVVLGDERTAVMEHKTTSSDISPTSDYWKRLQIEQQISMYVLAAREEGWEVKTVLYDVIRKPTIEPKRIPLVDENGAKIVLDREGNRVMTKDGKKPRETSDKELGYEMQTRPETLDEWESRLF